MTKPPQYEGQLGLRVLDQDQGTDVERLDVLGCQAALFDWAESYDSKDWDRLSKCIAPTLRVGLFSLDILGLNSLR